MSVSKLIEDQLAVFQAIEKRFDERISADNLQSRLTAATDDQIKRIQTRIGRLEKEKSAAVARYDAAIASERKALEDVEVRRKTVLDTAKPRSARAQPKPEAVSTSKTRSSKSPRKQASTRKSPETRRKS